MNAAELIEYIRTAEKKTPVKVYIWERFPTSFPNAKVFPAGDGAVSLGQAAWLVWRGQGRNGAAAAPAGSAELKPAPPDSAATPELP